MKKKLLSDYEKAKKLTKDYTFNKGISRSIHTALVVDAMDLYKISRDEAERVVELIDVHLILNANKP